LRSLAHGAHFERYSTQLRVRPSPEVFATRAGRWSTPRRDPMQRLRFHHVRRVAFAVQQRGYASAARTADTAAVFLRPAQPVESRPAASAALDAAEPCVGGAAGRSCGCGETPAAGRGRAAATGNPHPVGCGGPVRRCAYRGSTARECRASPAQSSILIPPQQRSLDAESPIPSPRPPAVRSKQCTSKSKATAPRSSCCTAGPCTAACSRR